MYAAVRSLQDRWIFVVFDCYKHTTPSASVVVMNHFLKFIVAGELSKNIVVSVILKGSYVYSGNDKWGCAILKGSNVMVIKSL